MKERKEYLGSDSEEYPIKQQSPGKNWGNGDSYQSEDNYSGMLGQGNVFFIVTMRKKVGAYGVWCVQVILEK